MAVLKVGDLVHMQDDLDRIDRKFRDPGDTKARAQRISNLRTYKVVAVSADSVTVEGEGGRSRTGHPDTFPRPVTQAPKKATPKAATRI